MVTEAAPASADPHLPPSPDLADFTPDLVLGGECEISGQTQIDACTATGASTSTDAGVNWYDATIDHCSDVSAATCSTIGGTQHSHTCSDYAATFASYQFTPDTQSADCSIVGGQVRGMSAMCCGGNAGAGTCDSMLPICAGTVAPAHCTL